MPDKFNRPGDPAGALYHDITCGNVEAVEQAIRETPELIHGKPVIDGAWSHGARRCGAQDNVVECLWLIIENGARFEDCHVQTIDSAFKTFPRAAMLLFDHGANANAAERDGTSALHLMSAIGYQFAVEVLLQHGADANSRTGNGETPLDVAVHRKHRRMTSFLRNYAATGDLTSSGEIHVPYAKTNIVMRAHRRKAEAMWYRADRGYGYLRDSTGYGDLFFDAESVAGKAPVSIEQGVELSFEVAHDKFGLRAANIEFGIEYP